ncbi:mini-chromosome maintenance complex-binding protein [Stigmatopora argus]
MNDVPLHYLKPDSLVKFRCLIQDMFDPEFYMGVYETIDPSSAAKVLRCGKYKDVAECGVDLNSKNNVASERQTFYCVPVPGENSWVKTGYADQNQARVLLPSTSYVANRQKRSYEDDDMDGMDAQPQKQREPHAGLQIEQCGTEGASNPIPGASHLDLLNFPLPDEKGPSCLIKVYEDLESFKLNDTLEVYGILSVSPAVAEDKEASLLDDLDSDMSAKEKRVHNPPASLVPRLHMLYAKPVEQNNPLLPRTTLQDNHAFVSATLAEMASVREEFLTYLTPVLLGDSLAAEYLILHLVSTVYARRDVLPLGKFTLNLSGCPPISSSYTECLYKVIQQLVPSSFYLGMSLGNMNQTRLVPKKDYCANRLVSGALQLAKNTSLFIDETQLEQGQLDTTGVRNVTALGNVITWQKVDYDFNYHQMEFPCNINVLVASEGRSLLPSDCQIHLQPQVASDRTEEYLSSIPVYTHNSSQFNKFRLYLSVARQLDYSITDQVSKSVEDDFVEMRKDDPQSISAEDLHRMLVVARLLSLSLGHTSLSRDTWQRAKHLEIQRSYRMEQHKNINGKEP